MPRRGAARGAKRKQNYRFEEESDEEDPSWGGDGGAPGGSTVAGCLKQVGVTDAAALDACDNLEEEFKVIKKSYFKKILREHPDKGGDEEVFKKTQAAFEVLREMFEGQSVGSFASSAGDSTADVFEQATRAYAHTDRPSWEFYAAAAEETMPSYRVELAKSGRSKCKKTGELIPKGAVRVGSLDQQAGGYSKWNLLSSWRVPSKVWLGLPNPDECQDVGAFVEALTKMNEVLFCGMEELPEEARRDVAMHAMERKHWARKYKSKAQKEAEAAAAARAKEPKRIEGAEAAAPNKAAGKGKAAKKAKGAATKAVEAKAAAGGAAGGAEGAIVAAGAAVAQGAIVKAGGGGAKWIMPKPGRGNAAEGSLKGETCVLTGVFPEVGGGVGLNLGKDRVKAMIASFGGRVTGSVSGKTTLLVVGKEPGFGKVRQAREKGVRLVSLDELGRGLHQGALPAPGAGESPMKIDSFSKGYKLKGGYNGLALRLGYDGDRPDEQARITAPPAKKARAAPARIRG